MKDVAVVLGEWEHDGPVHIELAASGIEEGGLREMEEAGLRTIMHALTHCPTLIAEREGAVRVEVGGHNDSFALSVKIGPVNRSCAVAAAETRISSGIRARRP